MDIVSIILIALGLAMDCLAVSISKGIAVRKFYFSSTLLMAFLFGFFQAVMPLIGYFAGLNFLTVIKNSDHWLAFVLLLLIGGKMLWEGIRNHSSEKDKGETHPFHWMKLLTLSLATSIDALATGIIFVPYPLMVWKAITIIGTISFLMSILGMYIGVRFGKHFRVNVEILGGIILIGIGFKILLEHTVLA